jgi:hypothetical protein
MSTEPLAIQLDLSELRRHAPWPAGSAILVNLGRTRVRFWQMGNQWGDGVLSFEVLLDGRTWRLSRRQQIYSRNVPSSAAVLAGATHRISFDLGDGSWEGEARVDQLIDPGARLVAVYDVPQTPEAEKYGVWVGKLRSQPVPLI